MSYLTFLLQQIMVLDRVSHYTQDHFITVLLNTPIKHRIRVFDVAFTEFKGHKQRRD